MTPTPTLRVAAVQLHSGADVSDNLRRACEAIRAAAATGARLVVLPEAAMVAFGADLRRVAEPLDGPFAQAVRRVAAECAVTVVAGMFEPADDGRVYNTLLVTGAGVETSYRKIHLYDAFDARESDVVAPGDRLVTCVVDGLVVGLATCYDLRFAGQFTDLGRAGVHLVCVPASWGEGPGKAEQWDLMVRARAADAQAWLLACDQPWTAPNHPHPLGIGRSALVDPTGSVRARLGSQPGVLVGEVDRESVAAVRARVPIL